MRPDAFFANDLGDCISQTTSGGPPNPSTETAEIVLAAEIKLCCRVACFEKRGLSR